MAFDGIVISALVKELNEKLIEGRLFKIAQPESDELFLTIKKNREQYRLMISASASLPLIYITENTKVSPLTAPNFCMLLRKHINNGRITKIYQPGLERIINFEIEHLDELGDIRHKTLVCELMGKHSNIIFCNDDNTIIDSIKHIPLSVSSVREVLPGRNYFIPNTMDKVNPLETDFGLFSEHVFSKNCSIGKSIYSSITGISPMVAYSIVYDASIDIDMNASMLSENEQLHLFNIFNGYMDIIRQGNFNPLVYFSGDEPKEYSAIPVSGYEDMSSKAYDSISNLLEQYYAAKNLITRMRQKSSDLRRIVQTALEKDKKKYGIQLKQLADTEKKDKFKVYGELITTYGYNVEEGSKSLKCNNYYTNEDVSIPLDPTITPIENAKKYFDKYSKLKRTSEALSEIIKETKDSIEHLESIATSLDIASDENSLKEIKEELMSFGYVKRTGLKKGKKEKYTSKPLHFISSDGYHIYVGKNNYQNDELTFNVATGNDWWFHSKGIPGSHVIVKSNNEELPDQTFEEAAALAAFYSKGRDQEKVEIDYTPKKNIKKVTGGKPGFVIYHTNYSMIISPKKANGLSPIND